MCDVHEMVMSTKKERRWQAKGMESGRPGSEPEGWGGTSAALSKVASEKVSFWGRRVPRRLGTGCPSPCPQASSGERGPSMLASLAAAGTQESR